MLTGLRSALALALIFLALALPALAQDGGYVIGTAVIGSSAGHGVGGSYALDGLAGQAEAGQAPRGGSYVVEGGFWTTGVQRSVRLYLPLLRRP